MACAQTLNGIINDCAPSMGGIVEAYIANFADVTGVTVTERLIRMVNGLRHSQFSHDFVTVRLCQLIPVIHHRFRPDDVV